MPTPLLVEVHSTAARPGRGRGASPRGPRHGPRHLAASLLLAGVVLATASSAAVLGTRVELAGSGPVTDPQRTAFGVGPELRAGFVWAPVELLEVALEGGLAVWPLRADVGVTPTSRPRASDLLELGVGARLNGPLLAGRVVPWVGPSLAAGVTGGQPVVIFGAGLGAAYRLHVRGLRVLLGFVARYRHAVGLAVEPGHASVTAGVVSLGLEGVLLLGTPRDAGARTSAAASAPTPSTKPSSPPPAGASAAPAQKGPRGSGEAQGPARDAPCAPSSDGGAAPCATPPREDAGVPATRTSGVETSGLHADAGTPRTASGRAAPLEAEPEAEAETEPESAKGAGAPGRLVVKAAKVRFSQRIPFDPQATKWRRRAGATLDELARILGEREGLCLRITGHTDGADSPADPAALSLQRAVAVRDALIDRGVAAERLEVRGAGSQRPDPLPTKGSGSPTSRRVDFATVRCRAKGAAP